MSNYLKRIRGHTIWLKALNFDSVIVDAGAHRGEFSRALTDKFACRCCLIEANPILAQKLLDSGFTDVTSAALAPKDGTAEFIFRENLESGSILKRNMDNAPEKKRIRTITLSTLMQEAGIKQIDLLKLDIEGAEFPLIAETPDAVIKNIGQITAEFHDFLPELQRQNLYENAKKRLVSLGFICCPMSIRTHGDVLFLNRETATISSFKVWYLLFAARWLRRVFSWL